MPDSPSGPAAGAPRRTRKPAAAPVPTSDRRRVQRSGPAPDDRFFRYIVSSTRNGVIAFRRDGTLALMNDEAYRIFGLTPGPRDVGRPFSEVLHDRPAIIRVLASAFELSHLPN